MPLNIFAGTSTKVGNKLKDLFRRGRITPEGKVVYDEQPAAPAAPSGNLPLPGATLENVGATLKPGPLGAGAPNIGLLPPKPPVSPIADEISRRAGAMTLPPATLPTGKVGEVKLAPSGAEAPVPGAPKPKTVAELLTERLAAGAATARGFDITKEYERLATERGIPALREKVGTYEEEVAKTNQLLDQLEGDITTRVREGGYEVSEAQRRRLLASERAPAVEELGVLERVKTAAEARLGREEKVVADILGLSEKAAKAPLEATKTEADVMKVIKELTGEDIGELRTVGNTLVGVKPDGTVTELYTGKAGEDPYTTQQRFTNSMALRSQFEGRQEVKDFREINTAFNAVETAMTDVRAGAESYAAIDQALITSYNKMLDPGSVVRESEFARTPESISTLNRLKAKFGRMISGGAGLTDEDRQSIYDMAKKYRAASLASAKKVESEFRRVTTDFDLDPDLAIGEVGGGESDLTDLDFSL